MTNLCTEPAAFCEGDVLAVSRHAHWYNPRTWTAWRIQADTHSPWNHVGLLHWYDGEWRVIEAMFDGGVKMNPLSNYMGGGYRLAALYLDGVTTTDRERIVSWALSCQGKPYNWRKVLRLRALQWILGAERVGKLVVTGAEEPESYICSGLVTQAYRRIGRSIGGEYATPADVVASMEMYWECPTDR